MVSPFFCAWNDVVHCEVAHREMVLAAIAVTSLLAVQVSLVLDILVGNHLAQVSPFRNVNSVRTLKEKGIIYFSHIGVGWCVV